MKGHHKPMCVVCLRRKQIDISVMCRVCHHAWKAGDIPGVDVAGVIEWVAKRARFYAQQDDIKAANRAAKRAELERKGRQKLLLRSCIEKHAAALSERRG